MRLPLILILPLLLIGLLADIYIWRRLKKGGKRRLQRIHAIISAIFQIALLLVVCWPKQRSGDDGIHVLMWVLFAYFSVYLPKYIYCIFDLLASVPVLFRHSRIKVLSIAGIVVGTVIFSAMWWGALVDRYRIDVRHVAIHSPTLPSEFENFTIAQISDLHTGTFGTDTGFVGRLVDSVNALHPDVIVFTGDIVNRHTPELEPFVAPLSRLSAPMGVYSILGNHDYGDYYAWPSEEAKAANLAMLDSLERAMGWHLLRNQTAWLRAGADSIALIGVENVGDPPFHIYGNLPASYPGSLSDPNYKILLTHNPAHWTKDISPRQDQNIALTLSGHTHAMQMEVAGFSPAKWRYPTWGGLYGTPDKQLYVNIGAGEVGIPARIGALPEITLITLSR